MNDYVPEKTTDRTPRRRYVGLPLVRIGNAAAQPPNMDVVTEAFGPRDARAASAAPAVSGTHARIAPSDFHITAPCPGSVKLQEQVPAQPETDEAAEGTAAHVVATHHARGEAWPVGHKFTSGGREWTVDLEMRAGAVLFAATMGGPSTYLRVETPVRNRRVHETECWGTPDAYRYYPEDLTLVVGDYKYGHRFVEVFENLQVAAGYAVGVMEHLGLNPFDTTVVTKIVQPRAYHREGPVREWRCRGSELDPLVSRMNLSARIALSDDPYSKTGNHCLDCKARHICGTLRTAAASIVQYTTTAQAEDMTDAALSTELLILDGALVQLEARRAGVAAHVEALMRSGHPMPFHAMEPGQARLTWLPNVSVAEVKGLGALLGVTVTKPEALLTPTQCVDAGVDPSVMLGYSSRPPGALKLVQTSITAARKVFSKNS